MMLLRILLIFLIAPTVAVAHADTINDLARETQFLESELSLAKKPGVYFLFNISEKKIYFKARGEVLKEIVIDDAVTWDCPAATKVLILHKKNALLEPEREEIKPSVKKTEDKFEINALELEDMPSSFNLALDNGISISVSPRAESFLSKITATGRYIAWYVSRPLLTSWNYIQKRSFSSIYLTMDKGDAQSLYWSFYEGSSCLIFYK